MVKGVANGVATLASEPEFSARLTLVPAPPPPPPARPGSEGVRGGASGGEAGRGTEAPSKGRGSEEAGGPEGMEIDGGAGARSSGEATTSGRDVQGPAEPGGAEQWRWRILEVDLLPGMWPYCCGGRGSSLLLSAQGMPIF